LENESDDHTRLGAAHAIARSTLSKPWASLLPLFKAEKNNEVQMAIAAGLAGISADSVQASLIDFVQKTSHNSQINFIKSVHLLQDDLIYNYCSNNILSEKNIDLQLASAEYLSNYPDYCALFLGTVNLDSLNWRVRSMLLAPVITLQDDEYINYVRARYHESENLYERGSLLAIIATLPGVKEEIQQEILANDSIICTYGLDAYYGLLENESEEERRKEAPFLMDCLSSGSASVVTYSAYLLRDSIFISAENIEKLKSIAKQLNTAKMAEANAVLLNTIAFMEGREMGDDSAFEIQAISQDEIASLMNIRGFRVITNKGEIIMEAKAFEAPGTVLTIARLIDEGYYNGKLFHRVVPNFVIQTGCPNGDGWGTLDFTMRSEFSRLMYSTGAVGMASSGQDTESCQWFITHSPTPHLNGKYTLFAYVSSGMDVVQNIEIGDQILSMELLYTN
jgi:cyclophilin family peptidyl-prolyl cis-trans isomerase